jgi:hypothetical protein
MRRRSIIRVLVTLLALVATSATALGAISSSAQRAAGVDIASVAVGSVGRARSSSITKLPMRADLLGATWHGAANAIELRAQGSDGAWSRWVPLEAGDDAPDPSSAEGRHASRVTGRRSASNPVWVGDAVRVQVRAQGGQTATSVRVVAINATGTATTFERAATRAHDTAARMLGRAIPAASAMPGSPGIHLRAAWKASAPRVAPSYADAGVLGAVVHHTDGTNHYSCSQVPALLRGIQRYHMVSNGWNDIGYNFLVDRCGGVWEGREGGITRAVIGAHTAGFNTSTTGIALIGTHTSLRPSSRARRSLQRLIAWRLDVAHVKPSAKMVLTARTSDKFHVGSRVVVRAVSGHRDLFPTSCPGAMAYRDLNSIARAAWLQGGAKVANVTRGYTLAHPDDPLDPTLGSVTVRGTGSSRAMYLTLRLTRISTGEVLRSVALTGAVISTRWTPAAGEAIPSWDVRIDVNGALPSGQRARHAAFWLQPVASDPGFVVTTPPAASVTPGGEPADDQVHLAYTLAHEYRLGAWLYDPTTGAQVAELLAPSYVGTPQTPTSLDLSIPDSVAAGSYELRVGLPADPAAGRSIRRYALTVSRG